MYYMLNALLSRLKRFENYRIEQKRKQGEELERARIIVFWEDAFIFGAFSGGLFVVAIYILIKSLGA